MKKCPKCHLIYDDNLSFCLQDGTALIINFEDKTSTEAETQVGAKNVSNEAKSPPIYIDLGEKPTVASSIPPTFQPPNANPIPPKNAVNYFLLAILFLVLGVVGGGGLVLYFSGFPTGQAVANDNRSQDRTALNKTEKRKETDSNSDQENSSPKAEEPEEIDLDEPIEDETPQPKVCYLSDGGSGGGEVNVRRNCDISNCTSDSSTIVRTFANRTPLSRLGQSVRTGKYIWVKVSIGGGVYWVASSKIRCS